MMAGLLVFGAGGWSAADEQTKADSAPLLEPEDIEEILEGVHEALEDAREEMRDAHEEQRDVQREQRDVQRERHIERRGQFTAEDRDDIREALREAMRESQDALREAGTALHDMIAQNLPSLNINAMPLLAPMALGDAGAGNSRSVDETKPSAGVSDIKIENISGKTVIVGWDQDNINVKGTLGEDVEELVFTTENGSALVKVKKPDGRQRNLKLRSDITISVPKRLRVDGQTVSGGIEASGIEGSRVSLQSVSGGVTVSKCTGEITAHTTSGGISIHDATKSVNAECVSGGIGIYGTPTEVDAETVSGGVVIEGVQEEVSAESVSGRVSVTGGRVKRFHAESISGGVDYTGALAPAASLDLNTLSGGIDLKFTEEVSASFDLHSFSGGIDVDLPGAPTSGKKQLSFKVGTGDATVSAEAFSGGVKVGRK
jgi:DUF4097 and DUF4098 domain-containing protein YvlB